MSTSAYREFTGKSVEEALRLAREDFGVGLDDLDFEILTPGSRGVLGMGAEPARILAAPRSELGGAAPKREAAAAKPLPAPPPRDRERDDRGQGRGFDRDRGGSFDRDRGPRRDDRGPARDDRAPRREDRGGPFDRDRGPRRDDRAPRRDESRPAEAPRPFVGSDAPAMESEEGAALAANESRPRDDQPREPRPRADRGPRRDDRGPRRDDRRPRRSDGGGDAPRRGAADLTAGEEAEVAALRGSVASERAELEAADASPEALAAGKVILEQLLAHIGFAARVDVETGETSRLNVLGDEGEREELGALIGRKGERLSALQHLVNLMLSRQMGTWTRVLVDVEDYRGRRERQLREIAERAARRVIETGKMLQLEPMPALERRWIHLALKGNPDVATQSIGEEPNRRIVLLPRG
ncbi:MAG TPA: RNA-binding cell elongation regulator Jag/EloR [Candidatus Limnocylindria bacterium]|nr:RNA-binding cell elongation regulator Jag/EloR [Candidatus Limnocylindria bacterium]